MFSLFGVVFIHHFIELTQELILLIILITLFPITPHPKGHSLLLREHYPFGVLNHNYLITLHHSILLPLLDDPLLLMLNLILHLHLRYIETTEIL